MPPARCSRPLVLKNSGIHWSEINFRNLFFNESKVSVLATAASNGQKAAGNKTFGFFSFYMGSAIPEYSSNTYFKPTWDEVFDKTKVQTNKKALRTYCDSPYISSNLCHQIPEFKVKYRE